MSRAAQTPDYFTRMSWSHRLVYAGDKFFWFIAHAGLDSAGPFDRHADDAMPIVPRPNFALA